MKQVKVRALVLREYDAGESDKRLLLLCKGMGRLLVHARGAKKPKSKFMAAAQVFTYADFILTQGNGFYAVGQAEVIESFYNLRTDYDILLAAHLIAEVCERTVWDDLESDGLLRLAIKCLARLCGRNGTKTPPKQVTCVFLMRFFAFHGLSPQMDACIVCGLPSINEYPTTNPSTGVGAGAGITPSTIGRQVLVEGVMPTPAPTDGLSITPEGLICRTHIQETHPTCISPDAIRTIQFILENDLPTAFRFSAGADILEEVRQVALDLWKNHFEWELKSDI